MTLTIFISAALIFLIVFTIICKRLIEKLELPEIEWYDQKELPTELRKSRSLSVDVLIYDLDSKELSMAYYSYSNDIWIFLNVNGFDSYPKNFNWAYFKKP